MPKRRKLSDKTSLAAAVMESEMPAEMGMTSVSDSGVVRDLINSLMGKLQGGTVLGQTNPFTGNVTLNDNALAGMDQSEVNDILAHELTHARQIKSQGPLGRIGSFGRQVYSNLTAGPTASPEEQEAYEVSERRKAKRRDIELK